MSTDLVVDTREGGRASCADLVGRAFDDLPAGGRFVLVADHDPRPLHYMFDAERPGQSSWSPLEEGPHLWKVVVSKATT